MGRYQSGQMGQAVNLLALPSGVRIPPGPPLRRDSSVAEHSHGKGKAPGSNPGLGSVFIINNKKT